MYMYIETCHDHLFIISFNNINAEKTRKTMICISNNNELNASSVKEEITLHY